ncbi:hypothetical protein ARMA_0936 [Ardenticatena maritima]|uniref:O-antigen ligase-related domain-containing protein n=1 Tax=Ardenticatena maritima TaxID=872965 RepID=A0A0M9UC37_9CHLR|nr:O-antigen ligase family protein [Ardenticatena maritima]KPL88495.1 hypothetical protein SE16_06810 [Ardenticatena maritima]GAP62514.1 hypothetical protein ARMA_0936 [Ardenticatena maritima]
MNARALYRSLRVAFLVGDRRAALLVALLAVGLVLMTAALIVLVSPIVALALPFAAVLFLFMLRTPQWGLYAVVGVTILLPFAAFPFSIGFKPTFLDAALGLTFFVWFMRLANGNIRRLRLSPLAPAVLAFIGVAIVAFIGGLQHAPLDKNTLRRFGELLLGIMLFLVIVDHVRTRRQLEGLALVIIFCGALAAFIGVALYVLPDGLEARILSMLSVFDYPSGAGVIRYIEDNPALAQRATGTSVDPNVYGGLLILITAFTAPQLAAERPLLPRWLTAIFLLVMGLAMVLTFSRGAMVGLVVALTPLMLVRYRRLIPYAIAAGLLLLLLPQAQGYVDRFIAGLRGEDLATQMRFGEYKDALRLIRRYPWFGVGFSGSPDIDLYIGVSSMYLLMAEFMGLLGLGAFLATMGGFYWLGVKSLRIVRRGSTLEPILFGALSAVLGAMFGGIFDHYFFNIAFPHSVALYWLFVGVGTAAALLAREERQNEAPEEDTPMPNPFKLIWDAAQV